MEEFIKGFFYWIGFSAIASCALSSISVWIVFHLHRKYNTPTEENNSVSVITLKFLNKLFLMLWLLFFIAMAVDFKLLGPF
jgi:hypothetical protein